MSHQAMRTFSTEFKQGVVLRLEAGERLAAVADELKIKRKLLYEWRAAYRTMGVAGLNRKRGPKARCLAARASSDAAPAPDASSELARAKARIAELERKIGKQQMDLDFFREALRLIDALEAKLRRPARRPLRGHRSDERARDARRPLDRPFVRAGESVPRRLLSLWRGSRDPSGRKRTCATKSRRSRSKNRFYGYRRIGQELWRLHGLQINHKRLRRLMREDNLLCLRSKPFVPYTTNSRHEFPIVPNLTRGLVPTGLDQIWVADITYVRLAGQFVYLAVVLDAFSRKVVGWALADHLEASLAIEALDMALPARNPPPGLIHHSDRGVQYACAAYSDRLEARGLARQHEPRRQSLRQRQGRALHADPQGRRGQRQDLRLARRRPPTHRRLPRNHL